MANFSTRDPAKLVDKLFVERWSPRQYSSEPVDQQSLNAIFDAARWTPSCYGEEPWQFISSTEQSYEQFLGLLVEANQQWAKSAPVIGFVIASKQFVKNGKDNFHAMFDTGAAWMAMNLQASQLGYYAHGMGGIDYEGVYKAFDINPQTHQVICGFTLGKVDPQSDEAITGRKPLSEIWQQK